MSNLQQLDKDILWHPFTHISTARNPIVLNKGKGTLLYDIQGNVYIDAISSWWTNLHGHAHPYLIEKLTAQAQQLEHVIFADFTHEPAITLAQRLLKHLDYQDRVFYSDNGSTAVEIAVKMCFQYWHNRGEQKTKLIALTNAYHGDTFGAMSVGARSAFSEPFAPFLFEVEHLDIHQANEAKIVQELEDLLQTGTIAGLIVEPLVQGAAGMLMYSATLLDTLFALCKKYNVLCIADEVMTGFGRTGSFFACQQIKHKPDICCFSKGLTGGMLPMAITTCTNEIYEAFKGENKLKMFFHGHSFTANPLGCAVALASLDLLEQSTTQQQIQTIINSHILFKNKLSPYKIVQNIRQTGTILAFDICTQTEKTSYLNSLRDTIYNYCLSRYVLLRPLGNTLYILPPYCITKEESDMVYTVILDLLNELEAKHSINDTIQKDLLAEP